MRTKYRADTGQLSVSLQSIEDSRGYTCHVKILRNANVLLLHCFQTRDWNEELQTTRELARKNLPERLLRERAIFKVLQTVLVQPT